MNTNTFWQPSSVTFVIDGYDPCLPKWQDLFDKIPGIDGAFYYSE